MGRTGSAILVRSVEAALLEGEETESTGLPGLPGLRLRCFAAEAASRVRREPVLALRMAPGPKVGIPGPRTVSQMRFDQTSSSET